MEFKVPPYETKREKRKSAVRSAQKLRRHADNKEKALAKIRHRLPADEVAAEEERIRIMRRNADCIHQEEQEETKLTQKDVRPPYWFQRRKPRVRFWT